MAPQADLSKAWTAAEAAPPRGWELRGLVFGPRVADPAEALDDLAMRLREMRS